MKQLRDYQQTVVEKIHDAWTRVLSVLAVVPTGGGKTVIFATMLAAHVGASMAVVHRREIVQQISLSLADCGLKHRIIAPPKTVERIRRKHLIAFGKSFIDPNAQAGVASVQTLTSNASARNTTLMRWVNQVTFAVFDEGHHYVKQGIWSKAVHLVDKARKLFVTATPERADGRGLGSMFDGFAEEMIVGPTTQELIQRGFLSKFKYFTPKTDLDFHNIPITASGDVNTKEMRKRIVESHLVGDIVDHYFAFALGKKTIVFANDVRTAHEMAAEFTGRGVNAVALSGETDGDERERALRDFESGNIDVLVNVDLFDEGFDVPAVVCVMMGRKTESLAKYLQMVGRALRILEGKEYAIIIDPVENWLHHGMPNWPRHWTLAGKTKAERDEQRDTVLIKACTECTQPYEAYHKVCPYCGHEEVPLGRSAPEQVDGDLFELDVEGMAAVFEQIRAANMSDEEFKDSMAARNVPIIGRGRQLKHFQATKYRREVLMQLIGWWVGAQTGRDMSEIHRRFYHRFGVDIGTAKTLDLKQTEALTALITAKFSEDAAA